MNAHATQSPVAPYRACELCIHGISVAGARHCHHEAAPRPTAAPVHTMRAPNGPCGPEARHLDFPGLTR
mgnify:FL=1